MVRRTVRHAVNASATLALVLGSYTAPWLVGTLPTGSGADTQVIETSRPQVAWLQIEPEAIEPVAPPPVERPAQAEPTAPSPVEAPVEPEHTEPEPAEPGSVESAGDDALASVDAGRTDTVADAGAPRMRRGPTVQRRDRASRLARVVRSRKPKAPLSKKEERRKDRWERRQERLAEQPQCRDLVDQMLQVDARGRETVWLVGEELVACYRNHPGQFVNLGGMDWSHDARGRKEGLAIYVSSKARGDVARAIGLQRGDVLLSLNGVSLRNPATASLALTQLTRDKAKLVFERDGQRHVLRVSVVDRTAIDTLQKARQSLAAVDARLARAEAPADR